MIALFTDFGWRGPYVGQMHAVLESAPGVPAVIDLMHDAPRFAPDAAAHLLAALVHQLPAGTMVVGVVDPGVGTDRDPVIVEAAGCRFVGPSNGLFDVISARAAGARWWRITRMPERLSSTFHGRDLFAPTAAAIARDDGLTLPGVPIDAPHGRSAGDERSAIIYLDDFGNAMTGLRGSAAGSVLVVDGVRLQRGQTFADAEPGKAVWLVNSLGLVEIAVNQGSAAAELGLEIGTAVAWAD